MSSSAEALSPGRSHPSRRDHAMLDVYAFATPNSIKVPIALEELGLAYSASRHQRPQGRAEGAGLPGAQPERQGAGAGRRRCGRRPAGADRVRRHPRSTSPRRRAACCPHAGEARARVFEQLFFHASGLGPAFGQAGFFQRQAAEPQPLAIRALLGRGQAHARRARRRVGRAAPSWPATIFTIADIAHFGWLWRREFAGVSFDEVPHVARWYDAMASRPAVERAIARVNALVPAP